MAYIRVDKKTPQTGRKRTSLGAKVMDLAATPGGGLRRLFAEMARNNPTWGEERIAADLLLKLGIRVSLRTGRRDMPNGARGRDGSSSQRWRIVVRPHTKAMDQGQAWLLGSLGREEDFCSIGGPGDRHPRCAHGSDWAEVLGWKEELLLCL